MTRQALTRKKFWITVLSAIITIVVTAFVVWLLVRSS